MSEGQRAGPESERVLAGRYRLTSVVGSGGMGTVWRAWDETLDREIAVKEVFLHESLSDEERENRHRRALREARASARLNHPGVVTVHDVVDEDGRPWIVMELVDARSLQEIIDADGPLPPARAAALGRQIVAALRAAHAIGILHRDIKPANVLITADDRAVITDFGIAQLAGDVTLTHAGLIMGSPAYMSPERVRGDKAIPASDLWAVGATLYAACEGKAPHHRSDAMAVLAAVMTLEAPPPRNAGPLAPVLMGLLQRDPARRLNADQTEEALTAIAAGHAPGPAGAMSAAGHPSPPAALTAADHEAAQNRVQNWAQHGVHNVTQNGTAQHGATQTAMASPGIAGQFHETAGQWQGQTGGSAEVRPGRRRWLLPVAGVAAAAIIIPLAIFLRPTGGSGGTPKVPKSSTPVSQGPAAGPSSGPGTGGTATSAPASSRTPSGPNLVPASGPGFTLSVPRGWQSISDGPRTTWLDPVSRAYVTVDRTEWTGDPFNHWVVWEKQARADGNLPGLSRVAIANSSVQGTPAADIEFTWLRNGVPTHARDRGVVAGGNPYAVVVAVPQSKWNEKRALVQNVLDSFRPSRVG